MKKNSLDLKELICVLWLPKSTRFINIIVSFKFKLTVLIQKNKWP